MIPGGVFVEEGPQILILMEACVTGSLPGYAHYDTANRFSQIRFSGSNHSSDFPNNFLIRINCCIICYYSERIRGFGEL